MGRTRLVSLLFAFGLLGAAAPAQTGSVPISFERQVIALTNAERAAQGLPPLKASPELDRAASWFARDMATHSYFDHTDRLGRDVEQRLNKYGYDNYLSLGENIAAGQRSPAAVVRSWIQSPDHRENLFSKDFREIGVGFSLNPGAIYMRYWAQEFGSRENVYPVVIAGEKPRVEAPEVELYLYGEDWAEEMRLSNDNATWTEWEPFASKRAWKLPEGRGERTVYVELRNAGKVLRSQDSVELRPPSGVSITGTESRR